MTNHPLSRRRAGLLCHVTSLPSAGGSANLDETLRFLDFLADARLTLWQVLPLNPPDEYGSPYCSSSLHAFAPSLTSDLDAAAVAELASTNADAYAEFIATSRYWLEDYVRFVALVQDYGFDWTRWPAPLCRRDASALAHYERVRMRAFAQLRARQFAVSERWKRIKREANARGITILGDAPLYPAHASADVWANPTLFALGSSGELREVAGVPPDYFSATGQRWGNPVYAWDVHAGTGFAWWTARIRHQLALFDVLRIDHFRGLEAFWSIPATGVDATEGRWCPSPGRTLLSTLAATLDGLPLVAEDLGIITPEVDRLREAFALPGMRVLQFAFSGDPANPHLPTNYTPNTVAYTGTHDNDTTRGWFDTLPDAARGAVDALFGATADVPGRAIELVMESVANTAVIPLQDWLGLGSRARMNTPGERDGNWQWRCGRYALTSALARMIRDRVEASGRA